MYIRKEISDFLKHMPKELKKPKHWRKFVNTNTEAYNLILKHGNKAECTRCHNYFSSSKTIGEREVCPFCTGNYLVRNSNLRKCAFYSDLAMVDNVLNKVIIRYFEIKTYYNNKKRKFENSVVEYARIVPELKIELVNDRFTKYLSSEWVKHTKKIKRWRVFTGMNRLNQYYKAIYLDDIQEKLNGTAYQYAPIKEAIQYMKNDKVDLLDIFKKAKYSSFEFLMKAGLYQLALNCPEKFEVKGSFEKRFGLSKDHYKFMKKHNISYNQLQVLKMIKIKNISIINRLLKISFDSLNRIEKAHRYVDLIKLEEYSKKYKNFTLVNYLDYIRNLERLEIPLNNKRVLFPEDFDKAHDESVKKVKICDNKVLDKRIKRRYNELSKNEYKDNIFFIRPAKSLDDMKDEAKQQNNCVYKNYSEEYAFGDTDIYFLRKQTQPDKSLVTIEVKNMKIVQKEQKMHNRLTKEQEKFLEIWQEKFLKKVA